MIDPKRLSPADKITIVYLLISAPLFLLVPESSRIPRALFHLLFPVLLLAVRRSKLSDTGWGGVLLDVLPILVFGYCYTEMPILNRAFHPGFYFDVTVMGWEQSIFNQQPAMTLREAFPQKWLSEYLHFGYWSYYLYVPIMALGTWWWSGREAFRISSATLGLTFFAGFAVFILFPVGGPYYEFPRMDLSSGDHHITYLVRWILDQGASIGTAFPSSHTTIAVTTWAMCIRYCKPAAWLFLLMVPAMAVGAVYGGYHYAVDIFAGAAIGLLVSTVGHRFIKKL